MHAAFSRAVAYLEGAAEQATVDSAYMLESASHACPGAFHMAALSSSARAARKSDVLGLYVRAPRLDAPPRSAAASAPRPRGALVEAGPSVDPPWFDVRLSDRCLSDVLSCGLTERCHAFATQPGTSGYALTHQLLFFFFANASACAGAAWSPLRPFAPRVSALVGRVYREQAASPASEGGFDDAQAERLALGAAFAGRAFLRRRWLRRLVRAQRARGCWEEALSPRSERLGGALAAAVGLAPGEADKTVECNLHTSSLATCARCGHACLLCVLGTQASQAAGPVLRCPCGSGRPQASPDTGTGGRSCQGGPLDVGTLSRCTAA